MQNQNETVIKLSPTVDVPKFYAPYTEQDLEIQIRPRKKIIRVKIN